MIHPDDGGRTWTWNPHVGWTSLSMLTMTRDASMHSYQLFEPVMTSLPDVKRRAVTVGSSIRIVMAANFFLS